MPYVKYMRRFKHSASILYGILNLHCNIHFVVQSRKLLHECLFTNGICLCELQEYVLLYVGISVEIIARTIIYFSNYRAFNYSACRNCRFILTVPLIAWLPFSAPSVIDLRSLFRLTLSPVLVY